MTRRTKIVATLGPASSDAKTLARMIDAGLDVVRMNFSHGTAAEHKARVELVRKLARKAGRAVGVLGNPSVDYIMFCASTAGYVGTGVSYVAASSVPLAAGQADVPHMQQAQRQPRRSRVHSAPFSSAV